MFRPNNCIQFFEAFLALDPESGPWQCASLLVPKLASQASCNHLTEHVSALMSSSSSAKGRYWPTRAVSRLVRARTQAQLFRALWLYILFHGERASFHDAVHKCAWPDAPDSSTPAVRVLLVTDPQIIDRHTYPDLSGALFPLVRHFSDNYLQNVWRSLVLNPNKWMAEGRLSSPAADGKGKGRQLAFPPDAVIWMGDLTDGGRRQRSEAEWAALVKRFRAMFPRPSKAFWEEAPATVAGSRQVVTRRKSAADHLPTFYMPGNHDVGLPGTDDSGRRHDVLASDDSIARHKQYFGMKVDGGGYVVKSHQPSANVSLSGRILVSANEAQGATHELVLVNAQDLVGMEREGGGPFDTALRPQHPGHLDGALGKSARTVYQETYNFVTSVGNSRSQLSRVLLTHVPLFRPPNATCNDEARSAVHGVTREASRPLHQDTDRGSTYQNLVGAEVTNWLLSTLDPAAVFSGDDHDHCEYRHQRLATGATGPLVQGFDNNKIPELTVKSASMTEGVRRPGFARLSLYASSSSDALSVSYTPCLLPDQIGIWTHIYLPMFGFTLLTLLLWPRFFRPASPKSGYLPLGNNKRDDDEDHTPTHQQPDTRRSRQGWLRDLLAVVVVALPFWLACQTHFLF